KGRLPRPTAGPAAGVFQGADRLSTGARGQPRPANHDPSRAEVMGEKSVKPRRPSGTPARVRLSSVRTCCSLGGFAPGLAAVSPIPLPSQNSVPGRQRPLPDSNRGMADLQSAAAEAEGSLEKALTEGDSVRLHTGCTEQPKLPADLARLVDAWPK